MSRVQSKGGFTIIEAVAALTILAIVLTAVLPRIADNLALNTTSELRTGAIAVAQETMDGLRVARDGWPAPGTQEEVDAAGTTYTTEINYVPFCTGGRCMEDARNVTVEVSHNGRLLYQVESVFTGLDPSGL